MVNNAIQEFSNVIEEVYHQGTAAYKLWEKFILWGSNGQYQLNLINTYGLNKDFVLSMKSLQSCYENFMEFRDNAEEACTLYKILDAYKHLEQLNEIKA